jgi:hypothetical protein
MDDKQPDPAAPDDQVEDLDVTEAEAEAVKGGHDDESPKEKKAFGA